MIPTKINRRNDTMIIGKTARSMATSFDMREKMETSVNIVSFSNKISKVGSRKIK